MLILRVSGELEVIAMKSTQYFHDLHLMEAHILMDKRHTQDTHGGLLQSLQSTILADKRFQKGFVLFKFAMF